MRVAPIFFFYGKFLVGWVEKCKKPILTSDYQYIAITNMLYRKITSRISDYFKSDSDKVLVVTGARQGSFSWSFDIF